MTRTPNNLKRYNLVLPGELFDEVQKIAVARHTTVLEIFRKFVRLGIFATTATDKDATLVIRDGTTEKEIVLI